MNQILDESDEFWDRTHDFVTESKSGYLVDNEILLKGSELIDPSCKFWMCLYPAGTISISDGFRPFTGDVSLMWQDAKVRAIEYQTQLGVMRKRARYSSDPIIQDIIKCQKVLKMNAV